MRQNIQKTARLKTIGLYYNRSLSPTNSNNPHCSLPNGNVNSLHLSSTKDSARRKAELIKKEDLTLKPATKSSILTVSNVTTVGVKSAEHYSHKSTKPFN